MLKPVAGLQVGGGEVERVAIGGGAPLALIAGPCVIEGEDRCLRIAAMLADLGQRLGLPVVFKASFDKANRSSLQAFRGPGLDEGLRVLQRVRAVTRLPVTTDVHLPEQVAAVAEAVDLIQIPALLCRQTDLLVAAARSGRPVNLKKGQFLAPDQVGPAAAKLLISGAQGVLLTERGTSFGYGDLIVDVRTFPRIRDLGLPVCFDATHAVQRPGSLGYSSGGEPALVGPLARAAAAAGIDALFLEVHDAPEEALSDGPCMVPLDRLEALLKGVMAVDRVVRGA